MQCVRRSQIVPGANSGGDIGYLQIDRNPLQVRVRGEQPVEVVDELLVEVAVVWDQDLCQRNCGRDPARCPFGKPGENHVGQGYVLRIGFELVNEDGTIQRNPPMVLEDSAKPFYSQLSRSLRR